MAIQDVGSTYQFGGGYLKSFSSSLGLNGSPTQVNLEIVVDTDNGQSFQQTALRPGNISGITIESFSFWGMIQSWQKSVSTAGETYSIVLVDPRTIFSNVYLSMDGVGSEIIPNTYVNLTTIDNLIDVYRVYGSDYLADYNKNGMVWNKIKGALTASGVVNCYGSRFKLEFSPNFEAPDFYRIGVDNTSLDSLLQEVSSNLGLDYFVKVKLPYVPDNVNTLYIDSIKRTAASEENTEIDEFLASKIADGTRISHTRGQEIRSGPTDVVVLGSNETSMYTASVSKKSYGKLSNGILYTTEGTEGLVSLATINCDDPTLINNLPEITSDGFVVGPETVDGFRQRIRQDITVKGYKPTENVMRAALWSFNAFKVMMVADQPDVAAAIGLIGTNVPTPDRVRDLFIRNKFVNQPYGLYLGLGYQYRDESTIIADLVEQVWDLTRQTAEKYYGKQFVVTLPTPLPDQDYYMRYTYRLVDSTFDPNTPEVIRTAISDRFQSQDGGYKAYGKIRNVRDNDTTWRGLYSGPGQTIRGSDAVSVGLDLLDPTEYLFDNSDVYIAINPTQNEGNLAQIIVELNQPVYIKNYVGKAINGVDYTQYADYSFFVEFLRAIGFSDSEIFGNESDESTTIIIKPGYEYSYNADGSTNVTFREGSSYVQGRQKLIDLAVEYPDLGLAPRRVTEYTFGIPLENIFNRYGPFIASSSRHGGVAIIIDDSLNPRTYGSVAAMISAGTALAQQGLATSTVIDLAQITLAGLPLFNLGDRIGMNSCITNITYQLGVEGLVTTYSLQTSVLPLNKLNRILFEKIAHSNYRIGMVNKKLKNIEDYVYGYANTQIQNYEQLKGVFTSRGQEPPMGLFTWQD